MEMELAHPDNKPEKINKNKTGKIAGEKTKLVFIKTTIY